MTLLQLQAAPAEQVIERALAHPVIMPGSLISSNDAPLPNGAWKQQIFAEGAHLQIALAQARDAKALAIVIEGAQSAIQAVNPQIVQILTSINFGDMRQPDYVNSDAFSETEVRFGAEPYVLDGTLSLPEGDGPFAAVVIAHGSGPQSRDGTLGPLTAYRDIARGLASQGIAALRYDKRTFAYATALEIDASFTVDSETTDDALAAVDFLRGHVAVDREGIVVLGHSQGGSLTPRILSRDDKIAGGILLAAATRPFSQLLREQLDYIADVNPDAAADAGFASLTDIADKFDKVAEGASYKDAFGEQGSYFQSLQLIDALEEAKGIKQPLLILQGERDYQVTMADFAAWRNAFADDERVTLISYPGLNHQFMAQGDLSRLAIPQDYAIPAFVEAVVIDDMVDWIVSVVMV